MIKENFNKYENFCPVSSREIRIDHLKLKVLTIFFFFNLAVGMTSLQRIKPRGFFFFSLSVFFTNGKDRILPRGFLRGGIVFGFLVECHFWIYFAINRMAIIQGPSPEGRIPCWDSTACLLQFQNLMRCKSRAVVRLRPAMLDSCFHIH